jgi:CheY-like chemotaxis protein
MERSPHFVLVDDDLDDTSLFEEVLQEVQPSIKFQAAHNGLDAMNLLRNAGTQLPDLIFLDLNMPRMDGKQCLVAMKEDESLKNIPVIMYSTSSQSKDIEETRQAGAICFITKPTSIHELRNVLSAFVTGLHKIEETVEALSQNQGMCIIR